MRIRRHRQVGLAAAVIIMLSTVPTAGVPTVDAADPPAARCQSGVLGGSAPARVVCASNQRVGAVTPSVVVNALPAGFTESIVFANLANPTNIEFAADGRVFVAEKSGVIKVFDSVSDTTPTIFSFLTPNVNDFWDRGLLGLALDPSLTNPALPSRPWVYVLYTYDHVLGSATPAPRWGDACANPPGATTDGCVVSGRLSRFTVSGSTISGPEQVLIEDWCQQFPSHSVGDLGFGPDGALYVSSGEGASFNGVDYGQLGGTLGSPPTTSKNPCGDPGGAMTPATAEGGALRSQDLRTLATGSGTTYPQVVFQDVPAMYWRLGETSGTLADDSGANNIDGTYSGGTTRGVAGAIAGDPNGAVQLDGTTGYVSAPDANPIDIGDVGTIELWFRRSATGQGTYQTLYSKGVGTLGLGFGPDNRIGFGITGVVGIAETSVAVTDTAWHHLVATKDVGNNKRLYLDGVDVTVSVSSGTATTNADALSVGRSFDGSEYFRGSLDEVAVYPVALSAARVQAHFAAASAIASTDPVTLDGAILRVDPVTGAAFAGNPYSTSSDPNQRRIIAYGLRNPFRFELRPGTSELWLGDVGWGDWEEINRIANTADATVENFGWPCYEGAGRMAGYDSANLPICENLYAAGTSAVKAPVYTYAHSANVVTGDGCVPGSSSIAGMAFYPETGGNFPAEYRGGLFFADYTRSCIWWMAKGSTGQPDPATLTTFLSPAANPVDMEIGLDGALYYVDFNGNTIRRVAFSSGNQPPTAVAQANPSSGPAPLTVSFSATGSSDPEGGALTYAWDLDGDGVDDNATTATPSWTYSSQATVTVGLRVTDPGGLVNTDTVVVSVGNTAPVPVIDSPLAGMTWEVGQQIAFSGQASDAQDGALGASRLSWALTLQHCPSNCHPHTVQTFPGVASGSFFAPDHEYPSYLELTLTATDSNGSSASVTRRLDPQTVNLSFQSAPTGLQLSVNGASSTAPFTRPVIKGSANTVSATSPQTLGSTMWSFANWSDGGAATHTVTAGAAATLAATFTSSGTVTTLVATADAEIRSSNKSRNFGTLATLRVQEPARRAYVKFTVPSLSGALQSATLRLWVTQPSVNATRAYTVGNSWTETGITWNNAPLIGSTPVATGSTAALGTWVEFNVTSAITSGTTVSFALVGGSDAVDYSSRTGSRPPQLVIRTP